MELLPTGDDFSDGTLCHNYSLPYMISKNKLIDDAANSLSNAQKLYTDSCKTVINSLKDNYLDAAKMTKLNKSDSVEYVKQEAQQSIQTLKDGTLKLKCPIGNCEISTFKLMRHLTNQHQDLEEDERNYAREIAKKIAQNRIHELKDRGGEITQTTANLNRKKKFQNTALVSRKNNYKECILCGNLVINMSDHLLKTHKISKSDTKYKSLIYEANVVLKLHTKLKDGKIVKLEDQELEEVKKRYGEEINSQTETLTKLKEIRVSLKNKKIEINEEIDESKLDLLKKEHEELQALYKQYRYKDTKVYSEKLQLWRISYLEYLKNRAEPEAQRTVTIVSNIISKYEGVSKSPVDFDKILDATYVCQVLECFLEDCNTNSTTKIKYIRKLQNLISFLATNVHSPERKKDMSFEETLKRKMAREEVDGEFESCIGKLSKNRGQYNNFN